MSTKTSILSTVLIIGLMSASCAPEQPGAESRYQSFTASGITFRVAPSSWDVDQRGHHRAHVLLEGGTLAGRAEGVRVLIPWRRPDLRVESKKIIVTDAQDREIQDVLVLGISQECGEIIFRPREGCTEYFVYYLPFHFRHGYGDARYGKPWNDYLPAEYEADANWTERIRALVDQDAKAAGSLAQGRTDFIESCSRFNFWSPMGLIATREETQDLLEKTKEEMVIFPEDRAFPIQLRDHLPLRWTKVPGPEFSGTALRNEYYTWQLGIWAARKDLEDVRVRFSDLRNGDSVIPSALLTCFNQEGTNWDGKPIEFHVNVPMDKVQALWCGVQIPRDAPRGTYRGTATVSASGVRDQVIHLAIRIGDGLLEDHGDGQTWRHSRLRWLNSTIGMDDEPTLGYEEMTLDGHRIEATGKEVILSSSGLPGHIQAHGRQILERPMEFVVCTQKGDIRLEASNLSIQKEAAGLVTWTASCQKDGLEFQLSGNMEFDGHLHYDIALRAPGKGASESMRVQDIRLVTPYTAYSSEYFMGCGFKGGFRPRSHEWDWMGPYDSYWMGGVKAGLHTEFRGGSYHGPLLNDYKPAPAPTWSNAGKGRVSFSAPVSQPVTLTASTGNRLLGEEPVHFEFSLLITPPKELDTSSHFSEKYFHALPEDFDKAALDGCNIQNIHHARSLNPYINYPFLVREELAAHISDQHKKGRKVKLYYTIRELTTHCEEIYAFRSLGSEIFQDGVGYGLPWECEHLVDGYRPAWYTSLEDLNEFEPDAALVLSGNSRFINYWLEGLRWMEENYDLDGIYMDDVSFDRTTVKRIRKILDRWHSGALIDLHSNTGYSKGPANQYTEFFPYVNRLWFGESFRYNEMMPDEWLVTFSGIPFGQMSEMLQDGGNRFLGMVYGATARHSWNSADDDKSPVPVWKLWDEFGIQEAQMKGYWDEDCPVQTDRDEVKATCYIKKDAVLVSVGNFSSQNQSTRLHIDWKALGMDPLKVRITTPEVEHFQKGATLEADSPVCIRGKEGILILIER